MQRVLWWLHDLLIFWECIVLFALLPDEEKEIELKTIAAAIEKRRGGNL